MSDGSSPARRRDTVQGHVELRVQLVRMRAALAVTAGHLDHIRLQMEQEAEDTVIAVRPKARQFGRGRTTWSPPDEREYRSRLRLLQARRAGEIVALVGKADRQQAAIAAFLRKHRFNDPPVEAEPFIWRGFGERQVRTG